MKKNNFRLPLSLLGASVLILLFGMVSASQAAMYKYVDKKGVTHFTDRYESIPGEYRNQIQTIRDTAKPEPAEKPAMDQEKEGSETPAGGSRSRGFPEERGRGEGKAGEGG